VLKLTLIKKLYRAELPEVTPLHNCPSPPLWFLVVACALNLDLGSASAGTRGELSQISIDVTRYDVSTVGIRTELSMYQSGISNSMIGDSEERPILHFRSGRDRGCRATCQLQLPVPHTTT
jgi:hypothetical protein